MTPRVSKLVIQEFVQNVNLKQSLKMVLLRIESNSIIVKPVSLGLLIITQTRHVCLLLIQHYKTY
jgi:hypothetical protein